MNPTSNSFRHFFEKSAVFSIIATCFVLPFATSLLSLFTTLTIIFWLLSGKFRSLPLLITTNPIACIASILFFLFLCGLFYSPADLSSSLGVLKKYRELLLIPIVMSFAYSNDSIKPRCENAFLGGCIVLLLISYAMFFSLLPSHKYGYSIVFHITHSFFMSVLAFWAAHKIVDDQKYKYFWLFIAGATLFNLFFIAPGRTGMLIFPVLAGLFIVQRFSRLHQLIGTVFLVLLLGITHQISDNFSSRTGEALQEIREYEYGGSKTSLGQRFDWWANSLLLLQEAPVFGHGTGAFSVVHETFIVGTDMTPTDNPHSEYLLIAVQLGVTGLFFFCLLFIAQFVQSLKLQKPDMFLAQGVVVAMATGCIMNSFLFDTHQGHFFAIFSALYFSSSLAHIFFPKNLFCR